MVLVYLLSNGKGNIAGFLTVSARRIGAGTKQTVFNFNESVQLCRFGQFMSNQIEILVEDNKGSDTNRVEPVARLTITAIACCASVNRSGFRRMTSGILTLPMSWSAEEKHKLSTYWSVTTCLRSGFSVSSAAGMRVYPPLLRRRTLVLSSRHQAKDGCLS
jgi:hypothetical protein